MTRIDTPDGPVTVYDTAPAWDDEPAAPPAQRRRSDRRITAVLAAVMLAVVAATVGPIVASHL